MNRRTSFMLPFAVGLVVAITAALMMYCQERCFLGMDLEFWPMVLGIIGLGLIATSNNLRLIANKKMGFFFLTVREASS